jgi:hypothetical protein
MAEEKTLDFARFQASAYLSVLGPTGCAETSVSNYRYKLRNTQNSADRAFDFDFIWISMDRLDQFI